MSISSKKNGSSLWVSERENYIYDFLVNIQIKNICLKIQTLG